MNIVLSTYYKTHDPRQVQADVDVSVPMALRRLWVRGGGNVKVSHIHRSTQAELADCIRTLGGVEKASEALEEARQWLEAWDEGERQGIKVAHAVMEGYFADSWEKASEDRGGQPSEPRDPRDIAIERLIRSV